MTSIQVVTLKLFIYFIMFPWQDIFISVRFSVATELREKNFEYRPLWTSAKQSDCDYRKKYCYILETTYE